MAFAQSLEFEKMCIQDSGDEAIFLTTDKENYDRGDTIKVSGCISQDSFTKGINIIIYDPDGERFVGSTLVPNPDRTFAEEFVIDEQFALNGTYLVEVDAAGLYILTKTFTVPEFDTMAILVLGGGLIGTIYLMRKKFSRISI